MTDHFAGDVDSSFTATFSDIDSDGLPDLLLAADYRRSQVFIGDSGSFRPPTTSIALEIGFGMGSVVADFNGDLNQDWFVTGIFFPFDTSNNNGNRLMLGDGRGGIVDISARTGIQSGGGGLVGCSTRVDLDGDIDIFHVNGYHSRPHTDLTRFAIVDPVRLLKTTAPPSLSTFPTRLD
ncbi:MAG: VCBS repeat-containing protein [Sandaracinaceae bacterium]|nr:VCBS repeat-containing protein [Sandaracinaceae bacterium]